MANYYENKNFDPVYLDQLEICLAENDPLILDALNKAWKGWYDYFKSNGIKQDFEG